MISIKNEKLGFVLIITIALSAAIGLSLIDPIAQDIKYHRFNDSREMLSILNFWNVMSNLPFMIVGSLGLYKIAVTDSLNIPKEIKSSYILLFAGVTLVSLGSGYYHLWPYNQTLVWDRLPMTISFMALFSIIISEFISIRVGKVLLLPLLLGGVSSVIYWHFSELWGAGDLRFYAFVQFFPMLAIPVILLSFSSQFTKVNAYWWLLMAYIVAKVFEHSDEKVYNALGFISGHSIKHIVAALGMYVLLVSYEKRSRINR